MVAVSIFVMLMITPLSSITAAQDIGDTRDLDLTMSADSSTISEESVRINVTIANTGSQSSPAPVFEMDTLPSQWSIDSWSNRNAMYRSTTNEWLWIELGDKNKEQLTITLQPAESATDFTFSGEVSDGYGNSAVNETRIQVPEESDDTISNGPDEIDFSEQEFSEEQFVAVFSDDSDQTQDELSSAINEWFNSDSNSVNGVSLSQDDLSELINYWFNKL
jgi:hypothetical protein